MNAIWSKWFLKAQSRDLSAATPHATPPASKQGLLSISDVKMLEKETLVGIKSIINNVSHQRLHISLLAHNASLECYQDNGSSSPADTNRYVYFRSASSGPLTPLGPDVLETKALVNTGNTEGWRGLSKAWVQPGGADTVTMELTAILTLPPCCFPEEWHSIMDERRLKLHPVWRCGPTELG